jgi:hypothetical protein
LTKIQTKSQIRTIVRVFFLNGRLLRFMKAINLVINQYIIDNWMSKYKYDNGKYRYNQFATDHYIEEKLARKIVTNRTYSMKIETLEKICEARGITLQEFFKLIKR